MDLLTIFGSLINASITHGYFSTALLIAGIALVWKLYKGEQERGREFGTKFAAEIKALVEENTKAQNKIISLIDHLITRVSDEGRKIKESHDHFEIELKELKSEVRHLEDDVKELKHSRGHL